MKTKIEKAIEEKYAFHVPMAIRRNCEIEGIINNCPFSSVDLAQEGTKVLIIFLSSTPADVDVSNIRKYVFAPKQLVVSGEEVYLHCPNGYGRSKLSNTFIEQKLRVDA